MSVARIAHRYAKSLIELAGEQGKVDVVLEDANAIRDALTNRDFYNLLKSPVVHEDRKLKIFDLIFADQLDKLSLAFFRKLMSKNREMYIPEIIEAFIELYKEMNHITPVKLTSAVELSEDQLKEIRDKLEESVYTYENVELSHYVDPSIIGGFIIEFKDKLYDASVAKHLKDLRKGFVTSN
jgi:F-type H+-transporting ATPase subunit delta